MSRRESRVSMGARQTDALFEFENFKKKFLTANKQITKLNSTLSQRIEELNAQISHLYNENLRLRASEIALATELRREREKTRKVVDDIELAAFGLTKHLGYLRQTFNITTSDTPRSTPSPSIPTPPRAPRTAPPSPRLSRQPTVPGIDEEDEPPDSPRRAKKTKPRLSASKLPLPSRVSSPPPPQPPAIDFHHQPLPEKKKKLSSRRHSGLFPLKVDELSVVTTLPLDDDDDVEEIAMFDFGEVEQEIPIPSPVPVKKKEKRKKETSSDDVAKKPKFKDLTNEPRRRSPPIESDDTPARQFLSSSPTRTSLPRTSSSSPEPSDADRIRRVRKSVNYTEPKLNTKMRKPDDVPPLRKQRVSASALDDRKRPKRRPSSDDESNGDDDDECGADADADEEFTAPSWISETRRRGNGLSMERRHSLVV